MHREAQLAGYIWSFCPIPLLSPPEASSRPSVFKSPKDLGYEYCGNSGEEEMIFEKKKIQMNYLANDKESMEFDSVFLSLMKVQLYA